MKDIENRDDIAAVVNHFYDKVKTDDLISFFFTDVVPVSWEKHLPVMYDFWEHVVFGTGPYHGNPMKTHLEINKKSSINQLHFNRWIELFVATVDDLFKGENAERMKQRAISIATVMQIKMASA